MNSRDSSGERERNGNDASGRVEAQRSRTRFLTKRNVLRILVLLLLLGFLSSYVVGWW